MLHRGRALPGRDGSARADRGPVGAGAHLDAESLRLDGQRLFQLQLISGVIDKLEPLQDQRQRDDGFLQGEMSSDAGAKASPERLVAVSVASDIKGLAGFRALKALA